ncbi:MAG: hypothetical protein OXG84_08600 [Chloroflexi bacterium]|nr:hypothetical protein [Chloroflexota bacterium]
MNRTPFAQSRLLVLALVALLALSACRPDDTLDITPSPTPTPEPSATPSPTPPPADFVDPYEVNLSIIESLIELLPDPLPAGEEEWRRNFEVGNEGVKNIRGIRRPAVGREIYYYTQQGSKMSLNFAVFPDAEAALAEFHRKQELRSSLVNLKENDSFPKPNFIGGGLYGSFGLFQIENYFIEVFVEIFTTSTSPMQPLSTETIKFFENNRAAFEAVADSSATDDGGPDVLQVILDSMPKEIVTTTQWRRDFSRFDEGVGTPRNIQNGRGFRVAYIDQMANNFQMTYAQFDSADDAMAHYLRMKDIREGIEEENSIEDFPQPHVLGRGLYGSVALFSIDEFFLEVLMERAPGTSANPTVAIARKALAILEEARSG